jgi:predicted transcriptional regulator
MLNTVIRRGRPRKTRSTMVESLMTKNPITIKEDEPLQTAIQMMDKNKIKRLIIADRENKVKGIISRPDLVRLLSGR